MIKEKNMKQVTIKLAYPAPLQSDIMGRPTGYRVIEITDSVAFVPGEVLEKKYVEELCGGSWKVRIVAS